ncbi:MAG: murein biosynthesis integral membrane protein MurJ [Deltaproteobacteria bacterium GWC2_42_11]|nr:MAG: murein biosynthesis integral membrane protein MurJ [Deltaproteobacteria bacterium GWC2_42_11]
MTEEKKIIKAASIVGSATLVSRILGFVRDAVIAYAFGAGREADAFFVAYRIPNLLRRLVGEGALTVAFIPVFTDELAKGSREDARKLVSSAFTFLSIVLIILTIAGVIFSRHIVSLISPGFTDMPDKSALTISLAQWMFPFLFFISLVALSMGVLNSLKHFTAPAFSPVWFNVSIIFCALILTNYMNQPVYALAIGVVIGGFLQFAYQLPYLKRFGMLPRLSFDFSNKAIKKVVLLMLPSALGVAVYQIGVFITTRFASQLPEGSVSYLYYADRIMELPLGIFGIAVATAVLPSLSEYAARDDRIKFGESLSFAIRLVMFISIPATVGLISLGTPIVSVLFQRGEFTGTDADGTVFALYFYALGLASFSGARIAASAFYALKDTVTPVMIAAASLIFNVVMSLILMGPLLHGGLALATTLASVLNFALLFIVLRKRVGGVDAKEILSSVAKVTLASLIMGMIVYNISLLTEWTAGGFSLWKSIFLCFAVIIGILTYLAGVYILRSPELLFLANIIKERVYRQRA